MASSRKAEEDEEEEFAFYAGFHFISPDYAKRARNSESQ